MQIADLGRYAKAGNSSTGELPAKNIKMTKMQMEKEYISQDVLSRSALYAAGQLDTHILAPRGNIMRPQ